MGHVHDRPRGLARGARAGGRGAAPHGADGRQPPARLRGGRQGVPAQGRLALPEGRCGQGHAHAQRRGAAGAHQRHGQQGQGRRVPAGQRPADVRVPGRGHFRQVHGGRQGPGLEPLPGAGERGLRGRGGEAPADDVRGGQEDQGKVLCHPHRHCQVQGSGGQHAGCHCVSGHRGAEEGRRQEEVCLHWRDDSRPHLKLH
mmetsp:Transcript_27295/g.78640  ORF Transcript_27295/g.78640 Transcript_27295/m.78640 type:complete len:200 (-) Transcript_27295:424-1023(-)